MNISIEKLTEEQAKELLQEIINKLDELDEDDYFGSEGWRHFLGFEDR
jgi:hypothetical protein